MDYWRLISNEKASRSGWTDDDCPKNSKPSVCPMKTSKNRLPRAAHFVLASSRSSGASLSFALELETSNSKHIYKSGYLGQWRGGKLLTLRTGQTNELQHIVGQ